MSLVKWRIWLKRRKPDRKGENGRYGQITKRLAGILLRPGEMSLVEWPIGENLSAIVKTVNLARKISKGLTEF